MLIIVGIVFFSMGVSVGIFFLLLLKKGRVVCVDIDIFRVLVIIVDINISF